ncbi:hypothetical protein [Mesorhizobium sp.]|uniref:hypothetical protein n=1 Tax=Mesorhizobium sp. TaxID=1871066 RepID=UPI0025F8D1F3|nr:hypothetical protein [Mesorhizobium sp.]
MLIFIVAAIFGGIGAYWANAKNLNPVTWGVVCAIFPLIGLFLLALRRSRPAPQPTSATLPLAITRKMAAERADDGSLASLSEADVRASGKIKDVTWTYFGDNFYVGERQGVRKRFATIDDLKAFFGV